MVVKPVGLEPDCLGGIPALPLPVRPGAHGLSALQCSHLSDDIYNNTHLLGCGKD